MLEKNVKTIGIILFLLGIDGILPLILGFHLVPYFIVAFILIIIGAYLIFKVGNEDNNE